MPRKLFEEKAQETKDLSDNAYKLEVLAFENELNDRDFQQYAYDEGLIIKKIGHNDYFVVGNTIEKYNHAHQLFRDLEKLREQRYYMQKQEHARNIAPETVCEQKTLKKYRCTYCYPWSLREWCLVNGRQDLVEKYNKLIHL